jgi:hypothetical protein
MEPEDSLPYSQETATDLFPEPDGSSPLPAHNISLRSILAYYPILEK